MGLVGVKVRKRLYDEAIQDGNYALKETAKVNDDWLSDDARDIGRLEACGAVSSFKKYGTFTAH